MRSAMYSSLGSACLHKLMPSRSILGLLTHVDTHVNLSKARKMPDVMLLCTCHLARDYRPMAPLWFSFSLQKSHRLPSLKQHRLHFTRFLQFSLSGSIAQLLVMYSCAQLQLASSFPLSARSNSGQQGSKSVSKHSPQLVKRAFPAGKTPPGRKLRHITTSSAAPVGEIALLPSLFPVVLRAFSAGLLLYSSLRWASARSDRKQASACTIQ